MEIKCSKCGKKRDIYEFGFKSSGKALEALAARAGDRVCAVCRLEVVKHQPRIIPTKTEEKPLEDILDGYAKRRENDIDLILAEKEEMRGERSRLAKLKEKKERKVIVNRIARLCSIKQICERRAHAEAAQAHDN